MENPIEIKDDLFGANFGRALKSHKRPSSEYNSNPLKKGSLRKRPYSHVGHWEEFKDGMSSDAIEGEPSHLEANHIFSPSIPTLDVLFEPILDPDDPSYALSPETHDDPRNSTRHPKHGSHEGHGMTKKNNDNGWNVLRTYMSLLKNGWTRMKPYG